MQSAQQPSYAVSAGYQHRCPLCVAKTLPPPKIGDRVVLLNGLLRSGKAGTVSRIDLGAHYHHGTFCIHVDGERLGVEEIVDPERDVFAQDADFSLPDWFPPFCIRESVDLHAVVLDYINKTALPTSWSWERVFFYEIVRYAWAKRLPVKANEIWLLLSTHGVPPQHEAEALKLFEQGTELLVYSAGRRPIKKKRQSASSRGAPNHAVHRMPEGAAEF